jgi:hypothetical protein
MATYIVKVKKKMEGKKLFWGFFFFLGGWGGGGHVYVALV